MPAVVGLAGLPYSVDRDRAGDCCFIGLSGAFARERSLATARRLFLFSIIYLPLLLGALVADRLWMVAHGACRSPISRRSTPR